MSDPIEIRHTIKTVNSPTEAAAYGFAEGFGKALGWAVVVGVFIAIARHFPIETKDAQAETTQCP